MTSLTRSELTGSSTLGWPRECGDRRNTASTRSRESRDVATAAPRSRSGPRPDSRRRAPIGGGTVRRPGLRRRTDRARRAATRAREAAQWNRGPDEVPPRESLHDGRRDSRHGAPANDLRPRGAAPDGPRRTGARPLARVRARAGRAVLGRLLRSRQARPCGDPRHARAPERAGRPLRRTGERTRSPVPRTDQEIPPPRASRPGRLGDEVDWIGRVDYLFPANLVVETDGRRYRSALLDQQSDADRDLRLRASGRRVLRFTWLDIVEYPQLCVAAIRNELITIAA
jgi:Protein of unknown function (DUF559)